MADTPIELAVRDKVVVITGAARGIGQEFARSLAAAGASVVAADINDCSVTLDLIKAENGRGIGVALDVRSAESASDMTSAATRAFGRVDALINNAALYGALRGGRFDAIAEADWDAAMAVNVKGIPDYAPSSANSDMVQIMNNGDWWRHAMARNVVQFQKGLSEPAFEQQYGTEEQCRAIVIELRWPDGFECPACGGHAHSLVKTRGLFQCSTCRRQTSPIAGTIFAATKLPLRIWFRAMYHMTQTKQGISRIELGRRLGVSQPTAWKIKHKLKQVMMERDATKKLTGRIEIDDAYLGGERFGGKRGRGAAGKKPFGAAGEATGGGKPVSVKLGRVGGFSSNALSGFAKRNFDRSCQVVSDGLACFASVTDAGCTHQAIKTGSGSASARTPAFKWVNTALGNIKASIVGTYRSISSKHVPRYLAEFEYRFNRRYDLSAMMPRLCWASVRTTPMPYRLLKLAEVYA